MKQKLQHKCFPVNIANSKNSFFLRTSPVAPSILRESLENPAEFFSGASIVNA